MIELDNDLQSRQNARDRVRDAKKAQGILATFSQQQIDAIVKNVAGEAAHHAEMLAKMAVQETGFGNWQDKMLKNRFAALRVYDAIKTMKTVGIIHDDQVKKVMDVGAPLGVICALTPSTNPTSTVIYKTLIALKAGNAIIFSPHPAACQCSRKAIEIVKRAAEAAGAPPGCVDGIAGPTPDATSELMHSKEVALILATGGEGMVRAARASGAPTISGGPGNCPAFIERSADIHQAVQDIITSKTFDNGVICAAEQAIIVERCIHDEVQRELEAQGAYFINESEAARIAALLLRPDGAINPEVVGKTALFLSQMAGFRVPAHTRVLIAEQTRVCRHNPWSGEKLCPVLGLYTEEDWKAACQRVLELLSIEGRGHTLVIHTRNQEVIHRFSLEKPVSRILINTPAALGGIGATTNIMPALTLGCGAVGGGSSSDNIGPMNLLNIRKVGYGVRAIDELRPPDSPPQPTGVIPDGNPCYSIPDDERFTAPAVVAAPQGARVDERFVGALTAGVESEINEQDVERVIRRALARLGK